MEKNLEALRNTLEGTRTLSELGAAAAALGLSAAEQTVYGAPSYQYAVLTSPEPIPASALCEAMGWARPYALSGDVEQRRWHIQLWAGDLADPYGQRIATRRPEVGPWAVTAWLAGRPAGPLPGSLPAPRPPMTLRRTKRLSSRSRRGSGRMRPGDRATRCVISFHTALARQRPVPPIYQPRYSSPSAARIT